MIDFLRYQFTRDLANINLQKKFEEDNKISEADMKKYYEENKDDYYTDTVTASHILISTQDYNGNELSEARNSKS